MGQERHVQLFRVGRNQAVRIPVEFEFDGDETITRKEGDRFVIMPLREPADVEYGKLLAELATLGTPIGANDLLIAAHALSEGLTLVSDNIKEFSCVPSLTVVNWRSRQSVFDTSKAIGL